MAGKDLVLMEMSRSLKMKVAWEEAWYSQLIQCKNPNVSTVSCPFHLPIKKKSQHHRTQVHRIKLFKPRMAFREAWSCGSEDRAFPGVWPIQRALHSVEMDLWSGHQKTQISVFVIYTSWTASLRKLKRISCPTQTVETWEWSRDCSWMWFLCLSTTFIEGCLI